MPVRDLFDRPVIVDVRGEKCSLFPPSPADMRKIVDQARDVRAALEADADDTSAATWNLAVSCVRATSREFDTDEDAARALAVTGGLNGGYARAAIDLCLGRMDVAPEVRDAEEDF